MELGHFFIGESERSFIREGCFFFFKRKDGWMTLGWADDNERMCTMESRSWLRRFCLERGLNPELLDQ